jgi:hypothetical protein
LANVSPSPPNFVFTNLLSTSTETSLSGLGYGYFASAMAFFKLSSVKGKKSPFPLLNLTF